MSTRTPPAPPSVDAATLAGWVAEARERTIGLVEDLPDEALRVPQLEVVNPFLWEIGHVAWFQERWVLRHVLGREPLDRRADELYDSMAVAHDTRWDLALPSRRETYDYLRRVRDATVEALEREPSPELLYHVRYSVHHEDMHGEAFTYMRQTLGYPAPSLPGGSAGEEVEAGPLDGDVTIPGGTLPLGARSGQRFAFDNEKWAHPVELESFAIARVPVSQGEFAAFVDDGAYGRRDLWSDEGWRWCGEAEREHPVFWRRGGGGWERRHFDRWEPLEPRLPVVHVSFHEAEAYCRWAGRRLPKEAEWEAAATVGDEAPTAGMEKPLYPWGDEPGPGERANVDGARLGCVTVSGLAAGDSPRGCRQLIGNVWEWTTSPFEPYPGFEPDPYADYSEPWFGARRVLRGGSWATRARLVWTTYRNFFPPDRTDVFAGFRTCAL